MKDKFQRLPLALQKEIAIRLGIGFIALLVLITLLINYQNIYCIIFCLICMIFMFVDGGQMLNNCLNDRYAILTGVCTDIERNKLRRRIKSIDVLIDDKSLTIPIYRRVKSIEIGDTVTIYLPKNTPVYEKQGGYVINSYYAFDLQKGFIKLKQKIRLGNGEE